MLILSFTRCCIPFIVRWHEYGDPFAKFTVHSWIYSIADLLVALMISSMNIFFVMAGFIDFQRRKWMMKACGSLLDPVKRDFRMRTLPTINMLCPDTLYCWFQIRLCLMDLGRKYINRIFIYSSTFLGAYIFYLIFMLLQFFDFIDIQLSLIANVYAMYDIFIILTCIISMIWFGASVNDQYSKDKMQLVKIKQTLTFIRLNIGKVLDPAYNVADGQFPLRPSMQKIHGPYLKVF